MKTLPLLLLLFSAALSCSEREPASGATAARNSRDADQRTIAELAEKHAARSDWNIQVRRNNERRLTIEIQEVVKTPDVATWIVPLEIRDIFRQEGKARLLCFDASDNRLVLSCEDAIAKQVAGLVSRTRRFDNERTFAAVCVLEDVNVKRGVNYLEVDIVGTCLELAPLKSTFYRA